jgi:hypothetical protein
MEAPQTNTSNRLSLRLYSAARERPVVALIIAAALVYFVLLFGPALVLGIRHSFSERTIEKTKEAAATEKTAAEQERIDAGQIEIERKAEDLHRDQELKPQRLRAANSLAEARARRKEAEDRYETIRTNRRSPDPDGLTLHRRNCADLAELYPDQRFAGCQ